MQNRGSFGNIPTSIYKDPDVAFLCTAHLIAGNEVEVLTAKATKSVTVVMVIVAPDRDMTSLTVSTTVMLAG